MRLLASTDFALRVLIYLAAEPPDIHVSVETLARELGGLSRNHLHKVVQDLVAHGLVRTVRGKGGGVQLALPPDQIRVGAAGPAPGGGSGAGGLLPEGWRDVRVDATLPPEGHARRRTPQLLAEPRCAHACRLH